ncbi:MAG: pseudaminic acid biosynthesis-associated methylase [Planctomycetota bacterium]
MTRKKSEQEKFWGGAFGDDYTDRNRGDAMLASNLDFFSDVFSRTQGLASIVELGANRGMNLRAIRALAPAAELHAVEINKKAAAHLQEVRDVEVTVGSIIDYEPGREFDLSFTKGVLIHIAPELLSKAYEVLYRCSRKYVLIAEYYNPTPVELSYRGHQGRLFKRDFAGEMMDMFGNLELVGYGYRYRRDPVFPQDDITWFLLRK